QKQQSLNITSKQQGFTLIELLIAITLMAVMAGLGWRGLDGLMRSRDFNQTRVDQTAVLQTVLAQWRSDLDHMTAVPSISDAGLAWDGQTLRIARRASTPMADGSDAGLWVVAWTRRDGRWWRWQSPALQNRRNLLEAWARAERWGKNTGADDQNFETPLVAIDQWQISYFRGNAWTNPLSSASNNAGSVASNSSTPDAIRLVIDLRNNVNKQVEGQANGSNNAALTPLATPQAQQGRLSIDWIRPNFSNNKS
ncbi:MAG: prepilin-type N-terminal cleavage/methylation domain-containing protein, partial [Burkholderiales bacterium]|nr:prepilin-type N-terminal cleavage/methylation domain-containing protein [Burkholderiales bacterium]